MAVDNTQYKDRLFNFLFGSEENKEWTLSLYNAVNGSNYTAPDAIEITTIKEVMYLGMQKKLNKYGSELLQLPIPKLVVFYNRTVDQPDDYVIKPFLEAHRAEVKGMLLTEYNEAEQMELFKEDGRREGRAEGEIIGRAEGEIIGREKGIIETLISLVKDGILPIKDAAKRAGITETAFEQKMAAK